MAGCYTYYPYGSYYGYGYGGSGPDMTAAELQCSRAVTAQGFQIYAVQREAVTGPTTARIEYRTSNVPVRPNITCYYESSGNTTWIQ